MITGITYVTRVVSDHDDALEFYTGVLGMERREDKTTAPGQRFVTVAPRGSHCELHLSTPMQGQEQRVGSAPIITLVTDDAYEDARRLRAAGVDIVQGPDEVPWGVLAVFNDPDGNPYELLEKKTAAATQALASTRQGKIQAT